MDGMEGNGYDESVQHRNVAYNLGDLRREEDTLISLYSKMKDQLHKLEVEELELKQKIRRKELKETTAELFPPPPLPAACSDTDTQHKKKVNKGKGPKRRKRHRTLSTSHDETASELDETMSITSALSQSSPVRSLKATPTPTRKSPRNLKDSPSKLKAVRNLTIPSFEPEKLTLQLDLSALNNFSVPADLTHAPDHFIESEDD